MLKYKCSICGREKRIYPDKFKGVKFGYSKKKDNKHYCDFAIEIYKK